MSMSPEELIQAQAELAAMQKRMPQASLHNTTLEKVLNNLNVSDDVRGAFSDAVSSQLRAGIGANWRLDYLRERCWV